MRPEIAPPAGEDAGARGRDSASHEGENEEEELQREGADAIRFAAAAACATELWLRKTQATPVAQLHRSSTTNLRG